MSRPRLQRAATARQEKIQFPIAELNSQTSASIRQLRQVIAKLPKQH